MDGFVKVGTTADVSSGSMKSVRVGNDQVLLANVGGKFYAIGEVCTHLHCPLARGKLDNFTVTCACHGSQFDVRTGEVRRGPAASPEPRYEVKLDGSNILLKATAQASTNLPLG